MIGLPDFMGFHRNMRGAVAFALHGSATCNENKQRVRLILSNLLQSFFISLKAYYPDDADAILERAEQQRWCRFPGQFGGKDKVDSEFNYAASFSSISWVV